MSDDAPDAKTFDAQLETVSDLRSRSLFRSALRTAGEVRRAAKAAGQLQPFLLAGFHEMSMAQHTFEPTVGRDTAVALIALLESPDAARGFQGDYDEGEYEQTVAWMSACAYDNLATHTAQLQGYNSPGMQACINDGIAVCRRTGKLKCITCFREYATQVFRAADDLPMALHHARENAGRPPRHRSDDRRFVGGKDEANLLLVAGDPAGAIDAARRAVELAKTYHSPEAAGTEARGILMLAATLADRPDVVTEAAALPAVVVPPDENTTQEWRDALLASLSSEPSAAIDSLTRWDRRLSDAGCQDDWFETRLWLIAAYRRAGQDGRAAAVAKPLRAKATSAGDHLTVRRLDRLLDPSLPPPRFPTAPMNTATPPVAAQPAAPAAEPTPGPLDPAYEALGELIRERLSAGTEQSPPDLTPVVGQLTSLRPDVVDRPADAARLLHMAGFLSGQPNVDAAGLWAWSKLVAANHPRSGDVLAMLGSVGDGLRQANGSADDLVPPTELADLFRRAMDLAPDAATVFGRAGLFFLHGGDDAEAERCLARSFRLDRSSGFIARQLADLYDHSDRPTDALAVLDLCLRESPAAPDPDVLWSAGLTATRLGRHEAANTYLSRLDLLQPTRPWLAYYRAIALLELKRFNDAANAIEREAGIIKREALHVYAIRAAAAAGLNDVAAVRLSADAAVRTPLSAVDYLSKAGVVGCFARLWSATAALADDDAVRTRLRERLLASGLTPQAFWDEARAAGGEPVADLTHYWVDLRQPLDDRWTAAGHAMPDAAAWPAYTVRYGVLAADEADATRQAVDWQRQSATLPAMVESAAASGDGRYTDRSGVTGRGWPEAAG